MRWRWWRRRILLLLLRGIRLRLTTADLCPALHQNDGEFLVLNEIINDRAAHTNGRNRRLQHIIVRILRARNEAKGALGCIEHQLAIRAVGIVDEFIELHLGRRTNIEIGLIKKYQLRGAGCSRLDSFALVDARTLRKRFGLSTHHNALDILLHCAGNTDIALWSRRRVLQRRRRRSQQQPAKMARKKRTLLDHKPHTNANEAALPPFGNCRFFPTDTCVYRLCG